MRSVAATLRIELFPNDLDRFVDFYTRVLGFDLVRDRREEDSPYVAVERGTVRIGAARAWTETDAARRRPPQGTEIVIEVDDVDAEAASVAEAGAAFDEPLEERPWGLRDFRLLDPDGHYVRITSRGETLDLRVSPRRASRTRATGPASSGRADPDRAGNGRSRSS